MIDADLVRKKVAQLGRQLADVLQRVPPLERGLRELRKLWTVRKADQPHAGVHVLLQDRPCRLRTSTGQGLLARCARTESAKRDGANSTRARDGRHHQAR